MRIRFICLLAVLLLFRTTTAHSATPNLGRLAYLHDGYLWVKALPDGAPQQIAQRW